MRRVALIVLLASFLLAAGAGVAHASIGVGTDVKSIEVTQPLAPGGTYPLHSFAIINTGTEASGYGIQVSPSLKSGFKVPKEWLTFSPSTFYLRPSQAANVSPVLHISADATPGVYRARLLGVPQLPSNMAAGGHVTVGLGPTLIFTVAPVSPWQRLYFTFMAWMPWSGLAAVLLVIVVGFGAYYLVARRRASSRSGEETPASGPEDVELLDPDDAHVPPGSVPHVPSSPGAGD